MFSNREIRLDKADGLRRIDNIGSFHKTELLPNGFMRVPATITRAGVFEYRQPDGSIRRELRPPEEVFSERSLDSLKAVVVTNDHPDDIFVTPANAEKEMVGFSSERLEVNKVDGMITTIITFTAQKTLDDIKSGKRELSCGYSCDLEKASGEHPVYGRYDAIQRNIVYNHIALVDEARGGEKLILHLDSADAVCDNQTSRSEGNMKYKIDGTEIECSEADAKVIDAAMKKRDNELESYKKLDPEKMKKDSVDAAKRIETLTAENTDLKARVDAKADTLQARIDSLEAEKKALAADNLAFKNADEKRRTDALAVRVKPFMPKEFKADGMKREEILSSFVKHVDPKIDLSDKSQAYIEARADHELARLDSGAASHAELGEALSHRREDTGDSLEVRKDAAEKNAREAWKTKPAHAA